MMIRTPVSHPSVPILDGADPAGVLAAYPHIAECAECGQYAASRLSSHSRRDVVTAALGHHDSQHRYDPLTTANEHFA